MVGMVMTGKGKGMIRIEPSVIRVEAIAGPADLEMIGISDHGVTLAKNGRAGEGLLGEGAFGNGAKKTLPEHGVNQSRDLRRFEESRQLTIRECPEDPSFTHPNQNPLPSPASRTSLADVQFW